jgi:acetyltransferase
VHHLGYAAFAQMAASSPRVDGVIVVVTARRSAFLEGDLQKLKDLRRGSNKPVFMWTYTLPSERSIEILNDGGYPLFTSAPGCARTMRALADYRVRREAVLKTKPSVNEFEKARANVAREIVAARPVMTEWEARPLLAGYGIVASQPAGGLAQTRDEAAALAHTAGKPVALKVQSPEIVHKTEVGAVILNVTADTAADAYDKIFASAKKYKPDATIDGVLVQPMAPPGREVILGVKHDERFGPMLMVGLGGVLVEALGDVALAPCPLDRDQAFALIGRLKGARLFHAFRSRRPADVAALVTLMVQLSHFAADHADKVAEIDLNPVIVHDEERGVTIADALIVKHAPAARRAAAE